MKRLARLRRRGRGAVIGVPVPVAAGLLPAAVPGRRRRSASPRWRRRRFKRPRHLEGRRDRRQRQARQLPAAARRTTSTSRPTCRASSTRRSTTLLCLAIGYPFAYFMARAQPLAAAGAADAGDAAVLDLVPAARLRLEGAADRARAGRRRDRWRSASTALLAAAGLIAGPGQLMNTPFSLVLGMTYTYLPFMILPLYVEPGEDGPAPARGRRRPRRHAWTAFWKITVPLSRAGIIAGSMLVFIPCVGEYVIPELLGGPQTQMIGRMLWDEFFSNNDWPMACAVAVTMILLVIVPLAVFSRYQAEAQERASLTTHARHARSTARSARLARRSATPSCTCRSSRSSSTRSTTRRCANVWRGFTLKWYAALLARPRDARRARGCR